MKKIIFLIHIGNIKKSSGIIEKVINQSLAMQKNNILYKTYIFCKKEDEQNALELDNYENIVFVPLESYTNKKSLIGRIINEEKIYNEYINICEREADNYDYIYVRSQPYYNEFIKFLKKFSGKIILEHNSIEFNEYKANGSLLNSKLIKYNLCDKSVRKCVKYFVAVTKEIYEYELTRYENTKGIVIANGINVKKYPLRKYPSYDGKNLNMVFVGNIRYWHGVERMLETIENYKGPVNIKFFICGLANQVDNIDNIINNMKNKNSVIRLGYKTHKELDKIFDESHIAIGSLAIYKFLLNNVSNLKNREYFARGIPIVFAACDDDISVEENKGLYLQVPNDDSPIKMEDIINFVQEFYKDIDKNTKRIRDFAEKNLDYYEKIKKLEKLIDEEIS